jgi:hypothetical protein
MGTLNQYHCQIIPIFNMQVPAIIPLEAIGSQRMFALPYHQVSCDWQGLCDR